MGSSAKRGDHLKSSTCSLSILVSSEVRRPRAIKEGGGGLVEEEAGGDARFEEEPGVYKYIFRKKYNDPKIFWLTIPSKTRRPRPRPRPPARISPFLPPFGVQPSIASASTTKNSCIEQHRCARSLSLSLCPVYRIPLLEVTCYAVRYSIASRSGEEE